MGNDRVGMKHLWRQFRSLRVKKVGYFDLFREAARHELIPDWFHARYGSVWQHAFVVGENRHRETAIVRSPFYGSFGRTVV